MKITDIRLVYGLPKGAEGIMAGRRTARARLADSTDQMKRPLSVDDGIRNQALIESGQLSTVCAGKRQEVAVRYLRGIQKATADYPFRVEESDVVGPVVVAGQCTEGCQYLRNRCWCARRVRITRMPNNS